MGDDSVKVTLEKIGKLGMSLLNNELLTLKTLVFLSTFFSDEHLSILIKNEDNVVSGGDLLSMQMYTR